MRPIESKERTSMRQLQNLPRHRRFHRNRPTCFAKIGAILVGRHRRCRRFNEVLQLPHHDSSAKLVLAYQTLTHSRSCRLKRIFSPARPLILLDFSTESFNHIALQCSAATMDANSPTHAGAFGLTQRQTEYIKTAMISTDRIPPQTSPTTRSSVSPIAAI